jgi:hypothetical protein
VDDFAKSIANGLGLSSIGFWILIAGLVGDVIALALELLKDAIPKTYSPWTPLTRWKRVARRMLPFEKAIAVSSSVIIILGVMIERRGDNDVAGLVEAKQVQLKVEDVKFQRLFNPRELEYGPALQKLRHFEGTPVWIMSAAVPATSPDRKAYDAGWEASRFASILSRALARPDVGWKSRDLDDDRPNEPHNNFIEPGILIWSHRGMEPPPYDIESSNNPGIESWLAGEALRLYLTNAVGTDAGHMTFHLDAPPAIPEIGSLPNNGVLVLVGVRSLNEDLRLFDEQIQEIER